MGIIKKQVNIYLFKIIMFGTALAIVIFCLWYFRSQPNSKFTPLLGGMTTGLTIALFQLILMWTEHNEMEKVKKLGIKKILPYRDDKIFYENVIKGTKKEIRVLGSTASRFLQDFADATRDDKRALIDALERNVHVKFLLPEPDYLWNEEDKPKGLNTVRRLQELKETYCDLIECRHYTHKPFHNLVLADYNCFVGPVFPKRTSQNTPTIYTDSESTFAKSYLEYFDVEWQGATSCLQTQ